MTDLFADFASLRWWLSVVIVGIVINIASAKLMPRLDNRVSKLSGWLATRAEQRNKRRAGIWKRVRNEPHLQTLLLAQMVFSGCSLLFLSVTGMAVMAAVLFVISGDDSDPTVIFLASHPMTVKLTTALFCSLFAFGIIFSLASLMRNVSILDGALSDPSQKPEV